MEEKKDQDQLRAEIAALHRRVAQLEASEAECGRTRETLREAERFARSTLDALPGHIAVLDERGTILFVNRAWREFARANPPVTSEVNEGANYLAVVDAAVGEGSEEAATFSAGLQAVVRGELEEFTLEYPCHAPWERRWFIARVVRFAGEGPQRVVVAHENITARQLAEEALRHGEERYRNLVEITSDWIWQVDENGVYSYVSPRIQELLGYTPEEVLGKTPFDLMPPAEAKRVGRVFRRIAARRRPFAALENTNRHKDGHLVVLETSGVPILDSHGRLRGYRGIDRDITDRKRAQEELRQSEEKYRLLFSSISHAIYIYDVDGMGMVDVNETALRQYGYSRREFLRLKVADLSAEPGETAAAIRDLAAGEVVDIPFHCHRKKDGTVFPVEISGGVFTWDGRRLGISAVRDITERKQAEQLREEYVSLISHDLRAPLTVVMAQADWLHRRLVEKGMAQESYSAESILNGARRMNSMIQDLVESARMESGRLEMDKRPADLPGILSELTQRIGTLQERARLRVELLEPLPPVPVDPVRIERVLVNLITNALKYSPPDAPVVIRVGRLDGDALISVTDQGMGIPLEDLHRLFERFYRAKAGKQRAEGLGLGLYITRLIVEAHGGRIWAESQVGKGSTFFFTLPLEEVANRK